MIGGNVFLPKWCRICPAHDVCIWSIVRQGRARRAWRIIMLKKSVLFICCRPFWNRCLLCWVHNIAVETRVGRTNEQGKIGRLSLWSVGRLPKDSWELSQMLGRGGRDGNNAAWWRCNACSVWRWGGNWCWIWRRGSWCDFWAFLTQWSSAETEKSHFCHKRQHWILDICKNIISTAKRCS